MKKRFSETAGSKTALLVLGFTTILAQLIIIREFLNIFQGNELVIGLILCAWMLFTAAGSGFGRYLLRSSVTKGLLIKILLFESIFPALAVFLLYVFEHWLFSPGSTRGLGTLVFIYLGLILPCCFTGGLLFTWLAAEKSAADSENCISFAYGWESLGSMMAGILFSFGLSYILSAFQTLSFLILINVLVYFILLPVNRVNRQILLPLFAVIIALVFVCRPFEHWLRSLRFNEQRLVYSQDSPYGNVSVTSTSDQYNIFENGTLFYSTGNNLLQEEAIHFALMQHKNPENVMIVSGGLTGMSEQALKYQSIRNLTYFEMNPWLIYAETLFDRDSLINKKIKVLSLDARRWIRKIKNSYDVIIVNSPDPSSAQLNRYFTLEFFGEAKNALRPNGIFEISLSSSVNYMTEEAIELNGIIYSTLNKVFDHVTIIPGERHYFIASDSMVGVDMARRAEILDLGNEYVNPFYLQDYVLLQQSRQIIEQISHDSYPVNKDLMPRAYFVQIKNWLFKFEGQRLTLIIMLIGLVFLFLIILPLIKSINRVTTGVFTGAFAGASAEFLMLILYQSLFGHVYQMLGAIVAFYMMGLTAGSLVRKRMSANKMQRSYIGLQWVMCALMLLVPVFSVAVVKYENISGILVQIALFMVTATIAFISGLEFNFASKIELMQSEKKATGLYGIDLSGAAAGTLLTSMFLFPLLGIGYTCLVLCGLNAASALQMAIFYKK